MEGSEAASKLGPIGGGRGGQLEGGSEKDIGELGRKAEIADDESGEGRGKGIETGREAARERLGEMAK